ncbi:MAG: DNA-formamidopyrimidine glycosylase [Planctomycetota bacterium]|nr:DNA-formamidopyrimidine glycosylase [Planctomycetota bacterium]
MPELPEVETVARLIRPHVSGRRVEAVEVAWKRTLGGITPQAFERGLVGRRILGVERRAKYLVMPLDSGAAIVCHLRMTGRLHAEPRGWDAGKFWKVRLALDSGRDLVFIDVRKFGRFELVRDPAARLAELGPEPLSPEFTAETLHSGLGARSRALKPLLLDQSFLAGLGNIYVDESLFRARLHPLANSRRVNAEQATLLHREIRAVLSEAIEREGSSFDTFYRTPEGNPGSFQHQFRVYGRGGEPCRDCGATIVRSVVGQRGTHTCPRCQPRPRRPSRRPSR